MDQIPPCPRRQQEGRSAAQARHHAEREYPHAATLVTRRADEYDLAGRLDQVDVNGSLVADYTYDANSNRLSVTRGVGPGAATETGTYDAQDRLLTYAGHTYTWTANGELATRTHTASGDQLVTVYDSHGNLRQATLPDGRTLAYLSDGLHRRVQKRINGTLFQQFVHLDQLEPHAELDGAGNVVANFVYADRAHVPSLMRKDSRWYRIVSDQLGSVRLVVDLTDGTIAQRLDYDEFGRVLTDTQPGFQPFGYAGGIYDRDTGLVRFGARDYDPGTGRWTAKDPAQFGGGENLYLYGWGDPIKTIDPHSEEPIMLPRWFVDASAGAGDAILFGFGDELRDLFDISGGIDACSDAYEAGEWVGIAITSATGLWGGIRAAGTRGIGREFSHWIPNRAGGPRTIWNGNHVTTVVHALSDPYRYRFVARTWKANNPMPPVYVQQWVRIPNVHKGAGAGAAYGSIGASGSP